MKFRIARQRTTGARPNAFTLIEVMVAVATIGVEFVTLSTNDPALRDDHPTGA